MTVKLGQKGEAIACESLRKQGFRILDCNFRSKFGEIDIIADKNSRIYFVEVKCRQDQGYGLPQEAVTQRKLSKIVKTAEIYLFENKITGDWQIDVITIDPGTGQIEVFDNVFTFGMN